MAADVLADDNDGDVDADDVCGDDTGGVCSIDDAGGADGSLFTVVPLCEFGDGG